MAERVRAQVCPPPRPRAPCLPRAPGHVLVAVLCHLPAGAVVPQIEETSRGPCPLPRSSWLWPMGAACGRRCLGEAGGPGGPRERGTRRLGQREQHLLPTSSRPPRRDSGHWSPPPSGPPAAPRAAMLHRRRLRGPEPADPGLTGPSPWWDLSPALAMRLHLLASLSGGGLAWRAGDRRWLAGEGQLGGHCEQCGLGVPASCSGVGSSWQACLGPGLGAGRHGACLPKAGRGHGRVLGARPCPGHLGLVLILAHSLRPGLLGSGLPLGSWPAGSRWVRESGWPFSLFASMLVGGSFGVWPTPVYRCGNQGGVVGACGVQWAQPLSCVWF